MRSLAWLCTPVFALWLFTPPSLYIPFPCGNPFEPTCFMIDVGFCFFLYKKVAHFDVVYALARCRQYLYPFARLTAWDRPGRATPNSNKNGLHHYFQLDFWSVNHAIKVKTN